MISLKEVSYGIYGAWRLAHRDRSGMAYFDRTPRGAIRSFYAALIAAPGYGLLTLIDLMGHPSQAAWTTIAAVETISYAVTWTALPLVVYELTRFVGSSERFADFLVAYNWCVVLQVAFFLPVAALAASGFVPHGMATLAVVGAWMLLLVYEGFVARVALDSTLALAIAVVAIDVVISFTVDNTVNALLY